VKKSFVLAICLATPALVSHASVFGDDTPGDGVSICSIISPCSSTFIGSASSSPGGLLTGSLNIGGSTLGLSVGSSPEFINFTGGTESVTGFQIVGPLGFNPQYHSIGGNNVGMPISGQLITLDVTNSGGTTLTGIAFFLELTPTVTSSFTPQPDGITFGEFCSELVVSCPSVPTPFSLLSTPTGPAGSVLNPADLVPAGTFGDLLRFSSLNIAPGATGEFTFYITDYKGTRPSGTGGSPASGSFSLEIVPSASTATPEPGTVALTSAGILGLLGMRKRWRRRA
jgi:hypothetical protein